MTQEYLSFVFNMYGSIYHDAIEADPRKPKYKFWRPALTKWFLRMDSLREHAMAAYLSALSNLRTHHLTA